MLLQEAKYETNNSYPDGCMDKCMKHIKHKTSTMFISLNYNYCHSSDKNITKIIANLINLLQINTRKSARFKGYLKPLAKISNRVFHRIAIYVQNIQKFSDKQIRLKISKFYVND